MSPSLSSASPPAALTGETSAALYGVARHAMGRIDANTLASVQAQPPCQPLYKRKALIPYVLAGATLLGVVVLEASMRLQIMQNEARLEQLEDEFSEKRQLKTIADANRSQTRTLTTQLKTSEQEVVLLSRQVAALNRLISRQELVPGVLAVIQSAMTEGMMIEQINQRAAHEGQIYVAGWALTNATAQRFVSNLDQGMKSWNIKVLDSRIISGKGRGGARGHNVEVWMSAEEVN